MASDVPAANPGDVPAQVFDSFLIDLAGESTVPAEVRERLRKALLGEKPPTENSLRAAIFGKTV